MQRRETFLDLLRELRNAEKKREIPRIIAYNRIDGPGSSLDLREFQQSMWRWQQRLPKDLYSDPSMKWSKGFPRTIGITIDSGTIIEAHPLEPGKLGIKSIEYRIEHIKETGKIPPRKEYWLLKAMEIFGLDGVLFKLYNIKPGTRSAGLGGSATATTGVCLLANKLSNANFTETQIVAMASRLEQDLSVSITGTQEQSNVVFGGIMDYIWFPWGIPGTSDSFGASVRTMLLDENQYEEIFKRLLIYHTGNERASSDVNTVWVNKLAEDEGYSLHLQKLDIAYNFREGIRFQNWEQMFNSIKQYQQIRTKLCTAYMSKECWEIEGRCEKHNAVSFPLGAGGGGTVMIFATDPHNTLQLSKELNGLYLKIDFNIMPHGHKFENISAFE